MNTESNTTSKDFSIASCRAERLSHWLDTSIELPLLRYRIGWDGILGLLLPGVGDWITTLLSVFIVFEAARLNVPAPVLARMLGNVLIDTAIGSIPFIGDLFDFIWKANRRNMDLFRQYRLHPESTRRRSSVWLTLMALALFSFVGLVLWLLYLLVTTLFRFAVEAMSVSM